MTKTDDQLPDYNKPPVIEVVCGVTFKDLNGLLLPHVGLLWDRYRAEYPTCQEHAPLAAVVERFDDQPSTSFSLDFPLPRSWFVHRDQTGIVQVQRDRFLHNWKKVREGDEYPRYSTVFALFKERLATFTTFLAEQGIGELRPTQYEMTYVNHVPFGETPSGTGDVGRVFPDFCWQAEERFLPKPEYFTWRTSFVLPPEANGRLHTTIRTARRTADNAPLIVLDMTARGMPQDSSEAAMQGWFDIAHEWIVKGFSDLTSEKMQKSWERTK